MAHVETMQEYIGGGESDLRELEHDADLEDEVNAFTTVLTFLFRREAVEDGGCAEELQFGEEPLGFSEEEELAWECWGLARGRHGG